jgi:phosphoserine aminotransferase
MSAIQSLLRVMTLRDAEAIVLEAGKVPSLRRRGQVEALAMPALEAALLARAEQDGLNGLAGHRSVGGLRASIYNAFPEHGVQRLVDLLAELDRSESV